MNEAHSSDRDLQRAIDRAAEAPLAPQHHDGHWLFELEADTTIPAEYVLLRHHLGEPVDAALETKIAVYRRRVQSAHGGWPRGVESPRGMEGPSLLPPMPKACWNRAKSCSRHGESCALWSKGHSHPGRARIKSNQI